MFLEFISYYKINCSVERDNDYISILLVRWTKTLYQIPKIVKINYILTTPNIFNQS